MQRKQRTSCLRLCLTLRWTLAEVGRQFEGQSLRDRHNAAGWRIQDRSNLSEFGTQESGHDVITTSLAITIFFLNIYAWQNMTQ